MAVLGAGNPGGGLCVHAGFLAKGTEHCGPEPCHGRPRSDGDHFGDYFGRTEQEGILSLAGEIPPPSLIQSWSDQRIVFVVPEDASSGLVTISNSQGTSKGVLFKEHVDHSLGSSASLPARRAHPLVRRPGHARGWARPLP